ncbi:MAG: tetratricopeptide repeat protein [Terricaulis sp.]
MSRLRLPRRFPVVSLAFFAVAVSTAPVFAQDPNSDTRAVTVIGADAHARKCSEAVGAGDSTDKTLEECTRALHYSRLSHDAQIQLLVNRGVTYLRRSQNDLALADLDGVIAEDPRNAEAWVNRGAALVQMRRYGEAITSLTSALSFGVTEPYKAYYNRGAAREALGDLQGAYDDYNTALEIQPDWGPANSEVARFVRGRREHLADVLGHPATQ